MKYSRNRYFYYIGFILTVLLRLMMSSTLITLPVSINYIILGIISICFAIKIILDNHNIIEALLIAVGCIISLYIYQQTDVSYIFTGFLSIIAIKNVDIKQIIKIDIALKLIFLLSHGTLYLYNYVFNYSAIESLINYSVKGVSHSIYFGNPNTVGALVLLVILDAMCLKKNIRLKDLVFGAIVIIFSYIVCKSRTPMYIYFIFVGISFINNMKIINFLSKYSYFIFGILSFLIIHVLDNSNTILLAIDKLFSNRLIYSMIAYRQYGLAILPNSAANTYISHFIIDNFFVRCFINYGVITLILVGLMNFKIPKKGYKIEKNIFTVSSIYLFFETVTVNTGFGIPMLIMGDIILYRNKRERSLQQGEINEN